MKTAVPRGFKFPSHANARQRRSMLRQIARGETPVMPKFHPPRTRPFCNCCGRKAPPTPIAEQMRCACGSIQFVWLNSKESSLEHSRRISQMVGDYYRNRPQLGA